MEKIILATTVLKKDQTKKRTAKINVQERSFPRALHHDRWSPPSIASVPSPSPGGQRTTTPSAYTTPKGQAGRNDAYLFLIRPGRPK